MVAVINSCALVGIDAVPVDVECVVTPNQLPSYSVVGLPAPTVKEGTVRIRSALRSIDLDMPMKRVVVNLAPADLRKSGCALDLPILLSILVGDGTYDGAALRDLLVLGELGLEGQLREVNGILASAMLARARGMRGVIVPEQCIGEALVVEGIEVYGVRHLHEIVRGLDGTGVMPRASEPPQRPPPRVLPVDMAEVRGQGPARYAIELAVAGGHNILLTGPPGTGKTMLARRIPTVLPAMTRDEALETTKVYSALGLADGVGLIAERPFRAPHHTISGAALLGGGSPPRAGEISLAHNGVLFLDELPEFSRAAIEGLREPLEERCVTINRIHGTLRLPSSFLLAAAANACPCGWLYSSIRECTCSRHAIDRYRSRLSGPLLDRIDLQVQVKPVTLSDLRNPQPSEPSAAIRDRVSAARERQAARLGSWGLHCNAEMTTSITRAVCRLDDECERYLADLVEKRKTLTARSIDRLIKVARTVADLDDHAEITTAALYEAQNVRAIDPRADLVLEAVA